MNVWVKRTLMTATAGAGLLYATYLPFRKAVNRLHPSWRRNANPLYFPALAEETEEKNLFVSSTVMRDGCDTIWREKDIEPPAELFKDFAPGSVVFVNLYHLARFLAEVLPRMNSPFVLVASCDTRTPMVKGYEQLYQDPKILHAFIQNCDFPIPLAANITMLPLGLNYHKLDPNSDNQSRDMGLPSRPGNQQLTLKALREKVPPIKERPLRVYANFQLNMDTFLRHPQARTRRKARREAYDVLKKMEWVEFEKWQQPRQVVWSRYQDFAFEASPRGNGWDCHRTYEAVLFKTIPILKRSPIDPVYDGLPVAFVDDWREVTRPRLKDWVDEFAPFFERPIPPKLYSNFWLEQFRRAGHGTLK